MHVLNTLPAPRRTRTAAALLLTVFVLAGCQGGPPPLATSSPQAPAIGTPSAPAPPATSTPAAPAAPDTPAPATATPEAAAETGAVSPTPAAPAATASPSPTAVPRVSPTAPAAAPSPTPATVQPAATNTALRRVRGVQLGEGTLQGVALAGEEIVLAKQGGSFASGGTLVSPEQSAPFPFNDAVLSWNARAPAGTSLRFELRAQVGSTWTPWYVMGTWGPAGGASKAGQSDQWAEVDVDTLKLRQPAGAWQYRVTLSTSDAAASPALQMLAVVVADLRQPLAGSRPQPGSGWARELAVPAYSQLEQDPAIARQICSPTSLTMVLNYYGRNKRVADVAKGVRDQTTGIFGDWPLNTAYAATQGMQAYVDRFYSMAQIQAEIAQGRPVIISIKFQPGELHGAPITSTTGHLIVVRGFTAEGNVIVNDPIGPNTAGVRRVYNRQELETIWLRAGGVVYLVRPA